MPLDTTTPTTPPPAPPYSSSPQSELRNRRSSSISIASRNRYNSGDSQHSKHNSLSLSTSIRPPSVDWGTTWNWPAGTSGGAIPIRQQQSQEQPSQLTEEPEEYKVSSAHNSRRSGSKSATTSPRISPIGHLARIRTRSNDSQQPSTTPSLPVAPSRRARKQQYSTTHNPYHSHRHTHIPSSTRGMSRPTGTANTPYADTHDFGNDGDGEADRGMTESSSGFVTSDEHEFTDEPEPYTQQQQNGGRRDFGGGGGNKYAYDRQDQDGDDLTASGSVRTSGKAYRLKRPSRKSSVKTLIPATSTGRKSSGSGSIKQKLFIAALTILGLFLLGTVIVLSTIQRYFRIEDWAYLSEGEIGGWTDNGVMDGLIPALMDLDAGMGNVTVPANRTMGYGMDDELELDPWGPNGEGTGGYWMKSDWDGTVQDTESWDRLYNVTLKPGERIPRIIHQTWKSDVLPEKWRKIWMECREGMPDYEYMLWTDEQSRRFIAEKYPQFLALFDGYEYPIQRADAIRYFILHHFGGVYMDLDIGCRRRLEPLISGDWDVVLPRTKPVGVSNDLIFCAKGHPFMEATIHGLIAFDHRYVTNYPTVMFSTGPMFLSAQYGLYSSAHPLTPAHPRPQIRILPKSLYGKNAKPEEAPHSFFAHYYGSSWHSDDAGFITFLGKSGKLLMYIGMAVFVLGGLRYCLVRRSGKGVRSGKRGLRRLIVGDIIGGGAGNEGGAYHMVSLLPTASASTSRVVSPAPSQHTSGSDDDTITSEGTEDGRAQAILDAVRRAGNFILAAPATLLTSGSSKRGEQDGNNTRSGVLYFLPAFFAPTGSSEGTARPGRRARTASMASMLPSTRTTRTGGRRPRQSSYAQSRLEAGNYHQPQGQSLPHLAVQEEDERYLSAEDSKTFTDPPPYENYSVMDPSMEEVDSFIKSQERS